MIDTLIPPLCSRLRAQSLRLRGLRLDGRVWLRAIEIPRHHRRIRLGDGAALDRGVTLLVSGDAGASFAIEVGARVYINRHTMIDACDSVRIGDDCMIGPFCYITDHDHSRGADGRPASGPALVRPVRIGDRVWIGAHVSILKGVTIGDGAIVGAGSVVTRDVAPGSTVVGNPATLLPAKKD